MDLHRSCWVLHILSAKLITNTWLYWMIIMKSLTEVKTEYPSPAYGCNDWWLGDAIFWLQWCDLQSQCSLHLALGEDLKLITYASLFFSCSMATGGKNKNQQRFETNKINKQVVAKNVANRNKNIRRTRVPWKTQTYSLLWEVCSSPVSQSSSAWSCQTERSHWCLVCQPLFYFSLSMGK